MGEEKLEKKKKVKKKEFEGKNRKRERKKERERRERETISFPLPPFFLLLPFPFWIVNTLQRVQYEQDPRSALKNVILSDTRVARTDCRSAW